MPIRGSFHIATGAAFHTAENDTEAALQGPSARFETNDGYVDVRVSISIYYPFYLIKFLGLGKWWIRYRYCRGFFEIGKSQS